MKDNPPARVRFGAFELDLKAGELRQGDSRVILPEQPFQLLRMLIERDSEIVTRDEIENELWPKDVIVEFDRGINVTIAKLRKALGDSADEPKYIETVASRGYRLKVPVERIETARGGGTDGSLKPEPGSWVGKEVSHYHVGEFIGSTRTGLVYAGSDNELLRIRTTYGRRVAMKLLPEEVAGDAIALRCFEREAFIASSLQHPNICHVHSLAKQDGRLFLVMELLDGRTLRGCLASGVLRGTGLASQVAVDKLLDIAIQISDGLAAAHGEGIIHRDIQPDNIFITKQGIVKILDFGLAHVLGSIGTQSIPELNAFAAALPESSDSSLDTALSRVRRGLMGFVAYKSPEQVRGEQLDARTDLFSLGLVLYEMATGRCAATIGMKEELHNAIVSQVPPPVRELRPDLPPKLAQVVDKALEKDRERRYQSAAALRDDLASFKREMESGSTARGAGQHSTDEQPTVADFYVPNSAIEQQTRFLEAAAPKEATVGRSIEVVAMVRREESGGLRAHLKIEGPFGPAPEDVQERAFEFEFAMDATGTIQPADIILRLESPDFEPRTQTKQLGVPASADSAPCTFLITPRVAGDLIANLELLNARKQVVVSRALRFAHSEARAVASSMVVLTIPLVVVVRETQALVEKFFTAAGEEATTGKGENTTTVAVASEIAEEMDVPPAGSPTHLRRGGLIGKASARYRVLEILGRGRMGVVYKVEDLTLGRFVALKLLPSVTAGHPEVLQRFAQEACIASSLKHPNICAVYEVGESNGHPFIVMEFLEGQTLRGCLASGSLRGAGPASQVAIDKLVDIAIQISDGLAAAHESGIIHRHIKPDNIFITKQGIVKILNFGLAHAMESDQTRPIAEQNAFAAALPQNRDSSSDSQISVARGILMGTPAYMSPEQARGEKLDARTDLFSFGLILYEMATGRRAFSGDSALQLLARIVSQTPVPSVRNLNPDIPRELERIIAKAVEKARERRYQSAAEMGDDLEKLRAGKPPSKRRLWKWLAIVALLTAVAVGGWLYWRLRISLQRTDKDAVVLADFDNKTGTRPRGCIETSVETQLKPCASRTRISSPYAKTPTPTFPSTGKPKPSTPNYVKYDIECDIV